MKDKLNLENELANSMNDILLNKIASKEIISKYSNELIENLNRSSEIFDELENYKAAEIVTKLIEKIASR